MQTFLGIRFLATEYGTGKTHAGRIDTLGLDENNCPCIIEYKRSTNENVINQGLYYLDWLLDHKAEFEILVQKKLGFDIADKIEWSGPRLICIAGDFTKYDVHAVQQINRNIELVRYARFGEELLMLDLVNAVQATGEPTSGGNGGKTKSADKTVEEQLIAASKPLRDLFDALKLTCLGFGDDVQMKTLKLYVAFKRIKNFASVEVKSGSNELVVYVKIDPDSIPIEPGFTRDVRDVGHWGTGDLQLLSKVLVTSRRRPRCS